ncbi:MAG: hypothetical protein EOO38_15190 [Cytophagaceae bacterium]|nr:MAG: hypothetical protein EOO38_15190 [Cytophagaceae bacterium]
MEAFAHIKQVCAASGCLPGKLVSQNKMQMRPCSTYSTGKDHAKPIGKLAVPGTIVREFWTTAGPVRKIVRQACKEANVPYFVPHSLRKTLTRLGYTRCRTIEEMKAWSQNLGHKSLETTMTSYGTLSEERKCQLIDGLARQGASQDLIEMLEEVDDTTKDLVRGMLELGKRTR